MTSSFGFQLRRTRKREDGKQIIRVGVCFGYWPCQKAPYVQFSLWTYIIDLWYGLPSHRMEENDVKK